jgi:hypothetical protein
VKESLDDVEKSSHVLEESVAVVSIFRHDRSGLRAVREESLHVVFPSKSVVSGSKDVGVESRA